MNKSRRVSFLFLGVFAGAALTAALDAATVTLPVSAAYPAGAGSNPGFVVRTVQAPQDAVVGNNLLRAIKQLNGTLSDTNGVAVANEAIPGANADGSYNVDLVNFEKDASPMDVIDIDNNVLASFNPDFFPGIPGTGGGASNFVAEVVTYLSLPAGTNTFGVSVGTDRTDVNDDDAFAVFVAANPRDFFATKVGEFQRSAPGFVVNTHTETQFTVAVTQAGVYPFRIVYWQTGNGANLQWYTVNNDTGERYLINDPAGPQTIKAYKEVASAVVKSPYVGEVSPPPGSDGNNPATAISAVIIDGATTVATSSVKLFLNGAAVTPQTLVKNGNKVSLQFAPNAARTDKNNLLRLEFADSASAKYTNSWSFGINPASGSSSTVAGQWDFDQGNLAATVGKPLQYLDGATGDTATKTKFGTTTALGIPDINGQVAKVMDVPGDLSNKIGYIMDHGISPNGGGTRVNQFTLIMDVMISPGAATSLLNLSSPNNTDDGDLFWQGNNFGQGANGYNGTGAFTPGEWHRIVAAYDEAANPPVVAKFVDGIKQDDWTAGGGLDAARRTLGPTAVLFGDGDQDERHEMWVNSIQIRTGKLSDAEAAALGGPSASGIPQIIPPTTVTGQWDFDRGDLSATIGKALNYLDGTNGDTATKTVFGTTTSLGIPDINGQVAHVMDVPGDLSNKIGYIMDHGISPNGGGTRVNQFTLIMDVMISPGAATSLINMSSPNNTDDGDLFWQGNNFGQGANGYNGTGAFTPGEWHRVVAAYDEAANPPVVAKFVDGIKQDDWTAGGGLDAARRTLGPTAVLFGDGDQDERHEMWVNSIQIRTGKISDAEAVLLGGPSATGIPVVISAVDVSSVKGQWDFDQGNLAATVGKPLQYLDGAGGLTETGTKYGTTTDLGLPDINGQVAKVMDIPGDLSNKIGYIMDHGISPNGGGTRVNQFTLIMDVMVSPGGATSLLNLSSPNNTDDGDLFWQGNNFGQGANGYNGTGAFTPGEWHRIVAAYDEAATPPVVAKFVDGIKQDDWTAGGGLDAARRTLGPTAVLFGDGDQDERHEMWVNSIQIRSGKISDAEAEALGGPAASGIPILITGVVVVPPAEPAKLTIAAAGNGVVVSWPLAATGFTLESSPSLTSPTWTAVTGVANNSVTITATGTQFYRLRK